MSEQGQNDQIIADVFRRSVYVFVLLALLLGLAALIKFAGPADTQLESSAPISPQSLSPQKRQSPPAVNFTEVSAELGLQHSHFSGAYGERLLPETMGGGVAVFDFNRDGHADILFVNGANWPWHSSSKTSSLTLYQANGEGGFEDVSLAAGLQRSLYGMGVAAGDYNADGYVDLFITAVGENKLLRNVDGQRFIEVSADSGVSASADDWSTGAAFIDHDRDGDLDLMVLNYVRWSRAIDLQADYQLTGIGRAYGPPSQFAGTNSRFYENLGQGKFKEISADVGIQINNSATGAPAGKGLGVLPIDLNNDGWMDLVVANDTVRNFIFINDQNGKFIETGIESGIAFDNTGAATGAMGIDGVRLAETGEMALAIGNFGNEMTSFFVKPSDVEVYSDQAVVMGIGPASRRVVTFGLLFFDYDLDGRLDLIQANGHIEPDINVVEPGQTYAQPIQLFWNCGPTCPRQFVPVELAVENALAQPIVGRGLASTDLDDDGDLDLIITQIDGPARVIRNEQQTNHNWIQLEVLLASGAPALGARVRLDAGSGSAEAIVNPTRSYLSQVDPVLTFGLGQQASIERAYITWPDGTTRELSALEINQRHRIQQGL